MRVLGGCGLGGCRDDLPNGGNLEPNLQQFLVVQDESSVEDERRLLHQLVDPVVVQSRELVPLGADHHGVRSREGRVRVSCYGDQFVVAIGGRHDGGVGEVHLYLFLGDLRRGGKTEREGERAKIFKYYTGSVFYTKNLKIGRLCTEEVSYVSLFVTR